MSKKNYGSVNKPMWSKINWTGLSMSAVGLLVAAGIVPEELQETLLQGVTIMGGFLIAYMRTYHTVK